MGLLVILPIAAAMAILAKRKIEEFLFGGIGILVLLIIASGLLGNTMPGVIAGIILGMISFVYCCTIFVKDKKLLMDCVLTPGLFGGLICMGIGALMYLGTTDLGSNNDTFWAHAPQILNMYRYSDIGDTGRRAFSFQLLYTAPVYTSWCYFCNVLWPGYSDGVNLWARQIFCIAALMPFFSFVKRKEKGCLLLMCLFIAMLFCFVDTTHDFMPDMPVGAAVIYGTITTMKFYRDRERYNDPWYLLCVCVWIHLICVMKRAGGVYIYGMIGIAALYTTDRISDKKKGGVKEAYPLVLMVLASAASLIYTMYRYKHLEQNLFYTVMPIIGAFIFLIVGVVCKGIKMAFRERRYVTMMVVIGVLLFESGHLAMVFAELIIDKMSGGDAGDIRWIFYKFFETWFVGGERFRNGAGVSDVLFVGLMFILLIIARELAQAGRVTFAGTTNDLDNTSWPIFVGYFIHMIFYCFIYMVMQEGYIVDGEIGYTVRYFGPAVMLSAAVVAYEMLNIREINRSRIILGMVLLLFVLMPVNPFTFLSLERNTGWEKYEELYADAGVDFTEEDTVYCIGPDHCQYYVFPADSDLNYSVKDAQTETEEWKTEFLSGHYRYLLLEDYAKTFPEKYQGLFEGGMANIQKWSIYDVVTDGSNVKFVKCGK